MEYLDTLGDRIKYVRKSFKLSQVEFGERIRVSGSAVTLYEKNARIPPDSVIELICTKFGVSEKWLRTGKGDPFPPVPRQEEIGEIAADAAEGDPEEARRFFIDLIGDESDARILLLYKLYRDKYGKA